MLKLLQPVTRSRLFIRVSSFFKKSIFSQTITLLVLSLLMMFGYIALAKANFACFHEFYGKNLRGFLFSGFLTVGSFLLTLKTFVVVNLKEKLFDTQEYKENLWSDSQNIKNVDLYKPLYRLSTYLYLSIIFSILTAVFQFSIGLVPSNKAAFLCIWSATFTLLVLLNCLRLIKRNIDVWLGFK